MPRPVYILCSEGGAIDKDSNRVSHFNVVDGLQMTVMRIPETTGGLPTISFVVPLELVLCAVWARNADETSDDEFEMELGFSRPGVPKEQVMSAPGFKFEKANHRAIFNLKINPAERPLSGEYRFECRARKLGSKTWTKQRYSVAVEVAVIDDLAGSMQAVAPPKKKKTKRR